MNDYNQLCLPKEISEHLSFFPEFRKIDQLNDFLVTDLAIGNCVVHAICEHKDTLQRSLKGWGSNLFGQLGKPNKDFISNEPIEMTPLFSGNINDMCQVSSGLYHTLVLTESSRIFGVGQSSVGQLGKVSQDNIAQVVEIEVPILYN